MIRFFAAISLAILGCERAYRPVRSGVASAPVRTGIAESPVTPKVKYVPPPIRSINPHNSTIQNINSTANSILHPSRPVDRPGPPKLPKLPDPPKEPGKPAPSPPGASDSPRSGERHTKKWYRVSGHPGLWAYGYVDYSKDSPSISEIERWYQDPSYPKW